MLLTGKRMVSIDIGSRNLHIAEGRYRGGTVEIEKSCVSAAPANCMINGEVEDAAALGSALRRILKENSIRTRAAAITIQSTQVIVREFDLPSSSPNTMRNMAVYEMEQFIPPGSREYVYEFRVLQEIAGEEEKKCRIRAAAIPKMMVDGYHSVLVRAGLNPAAMDIHPNCISKLFEGEFEANGRILAKDGKAVLIDLGYTGTSIHVVSGGRLEFSRYVQLGGRDLDTLIASTFGISAEKAEQKKIKELDLAHPGSAASSGEEAGGMARAAEPFLKSWTAEIQKVLQYFESRNGHNRIEALFLYGGGANMGGITQYMHQMFNIPAEKLESMRRIKFSGETGSFSYEPMINAAGCMIRF